MYYVTLYLSSVHAQYIYLIPYIPTGYEPRFSAYIDLSLTYWVHSPQLAYQAHSSSLTVFESAVSAVPEKDNQPVFKTAVSAIPENDDESTTFVSHAIVAAIVLSSPWQPFPLSPSPLPVPCRTRSRYRIRGCMEVFRWKEKEKRKGSGSSHPSPSLPAIFSL